VSFCGRSFIVGFCDSCLVFLFFSLGWKNGIPRSRASAVEKHMDLHEMQCKAQGLEEARKM